MDTVTLADLLSPGSLLTNLYFVVLSSVFLHSCLTPKPRFRSGQTLALTMLLTLAMQVVPLLIYRFYALKIVAYVGLLTLLTALLYRDSLLRRLLVSAGSILLILLTDAATVGVLILFFDVHFPMIDKDSDLMLRALPITFAVNTVLFLTPSLIARRLTRGASDRFLARFAILPLSQMVLVAIFNITYFYSGKPFGPEDTLIIVLMVAVSVAADVVFYRTVRDLMRTQAQETRLALQAQHTAALAAQQQEIRVLRHDIANHLMAARGLARSDGALADDYLNGLDETFRRLSAADPCENRVAAAVLWGKASEAEAKGVNLHTEAVLPENIGIEAHDLMSVLSNLLDNALDAAARSEEKHVSVHLRREKGAVLIQVENTISRTEPLNLRSTSKADRSSHGLGLSIVRELCRKYHGSLSFTAEDGLVRADAVMLENAPGS